MNPEHYRSFTTEDFILDEDIKKLARGNTIDGKTIDWLKDQIPEKAKEITLAEKIIKGLKNSQITTVQERKAEMLQEILCRAKPRIGLIFLKYAASILLIVGSALSIYYYLNTCSELEQFAHLSSVQAKDAELILADGKRIKIESKQSKIEYLGNGKSLLLNDSSKITQSQITPSKCFNQIIVPYGKRSRLLLSDGTQVWVNSGSRLVYPSEFYGDKREVFLEGEAYFEVSKNKSKPFFVRTERFQIKVLGTKFEVQAYNDEEYHNTVLLEGKVSLSKNQGLFRKEYELLPNQKAISLAGQDEFNISDIKDAQNCIDWIYGYLNLEGESFQSLVNRISRYYNLDIEIQASVSRSTLSGKLDLKEDPKRILDGLSRIFNVKYEQKGEKIFVYE